MLNKGEMKAVTKVIGDAESKAQAAVEKMKEELEGVRIDSQAMGILKKIEYDQAHNEFLRTAVLLKLRESKEYKKIGMTWELFCQEVLGEPKRTVDTRIADIRPLIDNFGQSFAQMVGLPFQKIRYLGRSVAKNGQLAAQIEDGSLLIDGEKIPLTPEHKDEIEAAIDAMQESHHLEKQKLQADLRKAKKSGDKTSNEEIKALTAEKKVMLKELDRLKAFDPAEKDLTWSVDMMKVVFDTALAFTGACRKMMMDERIKGDFHIQGQVEGMMGEVEKHLRSLRQDWDEHFNADESDL